MNRRIALFCVVLLTALPRLATAEDAARLRTFYTGHSFHMFVPNRVAQYAKAAGIKNYQEAGRQGIGGSRTLQHWDLPNAKNLAKKAIMKGDVDVFTMAPHLKIPDEGIDHFVELGLKHNPKMRFLVQESWVPFDLMPDNSRIKENSDRDKTDLSKLGKTQTLWRGLMEKQVKAINQKVGRDAVDIVPAGDAVMKLRELVAAGKAPGITKQSEMFSDPIGHGKVPVLVLVSYCNFTCITGRSPVGLKVNEPGISAELNALLQRIAWETVSSYPMSGVKAAK